MSLRDTLILNGQFDIEALYATLVTESTHNVVFNAHEQENVILPSLPPITDNGDGSISILNVRVDKHAELTTLSESSNCINIDCTGKKTNKIP